MSRNAKIGVGVAVFLLVAWAIGDDGAQDAPAAPAPVEVPAPAPAPEPEPEPEVAADPFAYGDDAELDALWDACEADDEDACDDLYWDSPIGSEYEAFALRRVNELAGLGELSERDVVDMWGAGFILDQVWADMTRDERAELCLSVSLFGAEASAEIIVSEAPSFDIGEVAEWLEDTCP